MSLSLSLFRSGSRLRHLNASASVSRAFHASSAARVAVGDRLPSVELKEGSPGNKVSLSEIVGGKKALIIGVPAAFSKFVFSHLVTLLSGINFFESKRWESRGTGDEWWLERDKS